MTMGGRLNGRLNSLSRSSKAGVTPLSAISFAKDWAWSRLVIESPPKKQSSSIFVPDFLGENHGEKHQIEWFLTSF